MEPGAYALHAALEERHFWFRGRRAIASRVIASLELPADARLVELGSGTGGNLPMLARFGSVVAIEPDEGARAIARERVPDVAHLAAIDELSGRAFDGAFAFDVLEHLDDAPDALRRLGAWMVPGAPLVVTVPAHPLLFGAHDTYLHHRRRYTPETLRAHLVAGRFAIQHLTPINAGMLVPAFAMRAVEAARSALGGRLPHAARGMSLPPWPINSALTALFAGERALVMRGLPFGLSLLAVARWRGTAA